MCYKCKAFGHIKRNCPKLNDTFRQFDDNLEYENQKVDTYEDKTSDVDDFNKNIASIPENGKVFSPTATQADSDKCSIVPEANQSDASVNNDATDTEAPVALNSSVITASIDSNNKALTTRVNQSLWSRLVFLKGKMKCE